MTDGNPGEKDKTIFGLPGSESQIRSGGMQQSRASQGPGMVAPGGSGAPMSARRSSYPPPKFEAAGSPGGGGPGAPPGGGAKKPPLKTILGMPAMAPGKKIGGPTPGPVAAPSARPAAPVPSPAPYPVAPTPQPMAPAPYPVAPTPQPMAPTPQPMAPAPYPVAPTPQPMAPMQGITDQPLSKDGYAPTMMAYTGPGGPVAPAAAAPMPAPAPQPSPPSGPIPQPFTHSAAAAEQTVGQAAGQVGQAANQAAKELEKGFGSIGAGDMFGSKPAPAGAAAQGGAGPAGQVRNSTVWWLLGLVTCGLTTWFWLWKSASEMKAFTGNTEINPIIPVAIQFFFPPWGQLFFAYKMGGWMMQARQSVGLPAEDKSKKWAIWTFILFLSQKQIQDDMNELWEAVGGGA